MTTTARSVTPLSVITATGMSLGPSPLPCSQSDIRLAAAVTDDAGGLLHHLFTHHHGSCSLWLVRSLLQLSSGPNPAWTHRPVTLPLRPGVGKFLWGKPQRRFPLPAYGL